MNYNFSIEEYLRKKPSILDCRLLSRPDLNGLERSILYFVPSSGQYSVHELKECLATVFPETAPPDFWVPVNRLPVQADGELDVAALAGLPVIDEALMRQAESEALSQDDVLSAVSIVGAATDRTTPFYLDDLLPEQKPPSAPDDVSSMISSGRHEPSTSGAGEASISDDTHSPAAQVSARPATAHGDELPVDSDSPTRLSQALLRAAEQTDNCCLIHIQPDGSEVSQSYSTLLEDARRIVGGLRDLGVRPGDKLIFQLEASQDFLAGFWACQLGGFIPVPMSIAPQYAPGSAGVQKLVDTGKLLAQSIILGDKRLSRVLQDLTETSLKGMRVESIVKLREHEPDDHIHLSQPDDPALMLLTSGSTGVPKAVCQSHRALLARSAGWALANGDSCKDVTFNWMPLDHVGGIVMWHLRDMTLGCWQVHAPTEYILLDPLRWLNVIDRYRVTNTWAPNFAYGLVCDRIEASSQRQWDLSCIRYFLNGGEAIVPKIARQFLMMLAPHKLSATSMLPSWGMSETCSGVTCNDNFNLETVSDKDSHVMVGRPIPGFSVRIVDDKDQCVAEGAVGRLQVKGLAVTSGYYNAPDLTDQSFTDDGWFITGDLATLYEDQVTITGREKDVIIINGINYSGLGIERVVEEVEGVTRSYVAACAVNDDRQGGRESLAVFFVPEVSGDSALQALLIEIRGRVVSKIGVSPDYLVPLTAEVIPKTSIGKIQRNKLKQQFEAGGYAAEIKQADMLSGTHCVPAWFFRQKWHHCNPLANLVLNPDETVLLLGGSSEVCTLLEEKIHAAGAKSLRIVAGETASFEASGGWRIRPQSKTDYQTLISELQGRGVTVRNVVCLWPCISGWQKNSLSNSTDEAVQISLAVNACCQALAGDSDNQIKRRIMVVTDRVQCADNEKELDVLRAPVAALVKTFRQEITQADFLHLDIDADDEATTVIAVITELINNWNEGEVAWRKGKRRVPMLAPSTIKPVVHDDLNPDEPACFVITGGLGGIGVKLASHLLRTPKARVLLIGRNALDAEETTAKGERLNELARMPGEIAYINLDIADAQRLEAAIENQLAKWDVPLAGIFHLAGSYHEGLLADETATTLQRIFHAKIGGTVALANILEQHPNAFLANFSSTTSIFVLGGSKVGAYAAANQFLDTFTAQLVTKGYRSFSFNWSAWRQVGMNQGNMIGDALKAQGMFELGVEQALTSLRIGLGQAPGQMVIGLDADNEIIQRRLSTLRTLVAAHSFYEANTSKVPSQLAFKDSFGTDVTVEMQAVSEIPRNKSGDIDFSALQFMARQGSVKTIAPRTTTEQKLSEIWQRVLKLSSISVDWNFFEVGGQSLTATRLVSEINMRFGVNGSLRTIFENPTIEKQANHIDEYLRAVDLADFQLINQVDRSQELVLSSGQKRMWFMDQFDPTHHMYNISAALRFTGPINIKYIEDSINAVISRHEALRTTFPVVGGQPRQKIKNSLSISIPFVDLSSLPASEKKEKLNELEMAEAKKPFKLDEGPLIRGALVCIEPEEYALFITMHHIISDGWSLQVFFHDLLSAYQAKLKNEEAHLPRLEIQYADYAHWQAEWQKSEDFESKCAFWLKKLQGGATGLELQTDRKRPSVQTFRGARQRCHLPKMLSEELKSFSTRHGVSLYMVMLTAFKVLLHRRTRQEDIVIGTVTANRKKAELNDIIGFFVNVFVLRTSLTGELTFIESLDKVREVTLEAYDHMDVPFEALIGKLQPTRDLSRAPIFQIAFDLRESLLAQSSVPGLTLNVMDPELGVSKYDLHLTLEEHENGLVAIWEYATDLFDPETISLLAKQYQVLLESIIANPDQPISRIPLMSDTEQQQLLANCTGVAREEFIRGTSIVDLIDQQARENPTIVAVEFKGEHLTFSDLVRKANSLARYLRANNVCEETIIAISVERSLEMVIAMLGVMKAGAAYVPVDPDYPQERINYILQETKAPILLTQDHLAERFKHPTIKRVSLGEDWPSILNHSGASLDTLIKPEQLAYLIFTSGSTGKPKGVLLEHRGLTNLCLNQIEAFEISSGSRVLQFASFGFDASVSEIFTSLVAGATLCLGTRDELLPGADLIRFIADSRISVATISPSVLRVLPDADLPHLRTIVSAGEVCTADLVKRWGHNRRFINGYGPTEITVCATLGVINPDNDNKVPDIGSPLGNMSVYILDDFLQPVPVGVVGELCVSGIGVARGYLNQPGLTAECFVANPFHDGIYSRMYKTGDLAMYKPDGKIEYIGRKNNQIKLRGFRIELGEIENTLRQSSDVHDAVVMLREDTPGDKRIVSYIVSEGVSAKFGEDNGEKKGDKKKLELWPSIAEFFIYDELIYYAMTHDEIRNQSYKVAINQLVKDKIVLDVGTGRDAILSRFCVEGGAKKVYAIEILEESYKGAMATIQKLGLEDKIELIHGDATKIQLPEKVDVCVSEIVGAIGGSEGAAAIINNTWRFMKDGGQMIPCRSKTLIAGISLPDDFINEPQFSELTGHYVQQIFEQVGYMFDLRLSIRNLTRDSLITSEGIFEDLNYNEPIELEAQHEINLNVKRDGVVNGLLVWLTLETVKDESIDILDNEFCWLPVFLPVFEPAVHVKTNDKIKATITRTLCENGLNPDFKIQGVLERVDGDDLNFEYTSFHNKRVFKESPFYQRVFKNDSVNIKVADNRGAQLSRIKSHLKKYLPDYMQPSVIEMLDNLPLTLNGKIDRNKLPVPKMLSVESSGGASSPQTILEKNISDVWKKVLHLELIDINQNFFDIGGDSLKMAEVQSNILSSIGQTVDLVKLFQYPTIRALSNHLDNSSVSSLLQKENNEVLREKASDRKKKMMELAKRQRTKKGSSRRDR